MLNQFFQFFARNEKREICGSLVRFKNDKKSKFLVTAVGQYSVHVTGITYTISEFKQTFEVSFNGGKTWEEVV